MKHPIIPFILIYFIRFLVSFVIYLPLFSSSFYFVFLSFLLSSFSFFPCFSHIFFIPSVFLPCFIYFFSLFISFFSLSFLSPFLSIYLYFFLSFFLSFFLFYFLTPSAYYYMNVCVYRPIIMRTEQRCSLIEGF